MCGMVGIFSHEPVAAELYDSLIHLQHRGQDAAGILTAGSRFYTQQGKGYVREIFTISELTELKGNMGIAHVRYPTAGGYGLSDVQPLWLGSPRGIALAHNGNLVNYTTLADELTKKKHCHLNSSADSEVLLHLLAEGMALQGNSDDEEVIFANLCSSVEYVYSKAMGAYSVVAQVIGQGLLAFRDPHGIRPLAMGERVNANGEHDYIFASETSPFLTLGFKSIGDVAAGELVFVGASGKVFRKILTNDSAKKSSKFTPCIFEYVYFARPDSTLDKVGVYDARVAMGKKLAERWLEEYPDDLPDVVVPAPFTSNTAAIAFAGKVGVRYAEGLYKNAFIGRTFIMPDGPTRKRNVRYKLMPQKSELAGRNVLVLDDSIVRGNTSREIVKIIYEAGAKSVDFVSACAPIISPCFYGIDMPTKKELIAANQSMGSIKKWLGVNRLLYQTIDDLKLAVTKNANFKSPCMACMDGCYIVDGGN